MENTCAREINKKQPGMRRAERDSERNAASSRLTTRSLCRDSSSVSPSLRSPPTPRKDKNGREHRRRFLNFVIYLFSLQWIPDIPFTLDHQAHFKIYHVFRLSVVISDSADSTSNKLCNLGDITQPLCALVSSKVGG